jgi:peptidoglycan-associated lipoprotein
MKATTLKLTAAPAMLAAVLFLGGCAKKVAQAPPPPPPPPPAAPTVALSASPDTIQQGQSTTLTWTTQNATAVSITGLGTVPASGTRRVTPPDSTTYELTAKGAGGERETDARVTVNRPVAVAQPSLSDEELFARSIKDVYFDFDKYVIRSDEQPVTQADAKFLQAHPNFKILIEGHCDDRGSEEYNLALGDNRANAVKAELVRLGVSPDRIRIISYGKEKPFCTQDNEQCWQENRRDHFDSLARQ